MGDSHRIWLRGLAAAAPALVAVALGLLASTAAHARAFQVPCDEAALRQTLDEAGFNGEEDVVWLSRSCVYPLAGILIAYPDGGLPLTIQGNGATISGKNQRTVLLVSPGANVFVHELTITEGRAGATASGQGGAIYNGGSLTLTDSTVSNSEAFTGGGIYNTQGSSLTLIASTVSGNVAGSVGGGIHNQEARLTAIDSTFSGNTAQGSQGLGAAIYNDDPTSSAPRAVVTLSNCTFSGNASRFGAGIFNDKGRVTVSHCTFARNDAVDGGNGGAIYHRNYGGQGFFRLGHSILADHEGDGLLCARDPYLATNVITPTGDNLVEDASCQIAGAWSGDPKLGPLTGRPAYHPLLAGSPVIDLAPLANCPGLDQRGATRPKDGSPGGSVLCDLGSYEAP